MENKKIVLKKVIIDKNKKNTFSAIDIEFTYKGETRRRNIIITEVLIEALIQTAQKSSERVCFVNEDIVKTAINKEIYGNIEGINKWNT